jgi:hypothetical protein
VQVAEEASESMVIEVTAAIGVEEQALLSEWAGRFAHLVNRR